MDRQVIRQMPLVRSAVGGEQGMLAVIVENLKGGQSVDQGWPDQDLVEHSPMRVVGLIGSPVMSSCRSLRAIPEKPPHGVVKTSIVAFPIQAVLHAGQLGGH